MKVNNIMYEIRWNSDDVFSHPTVTPITVIREGVLPDCTGVSITARDSKGVKFQGSSDDYYASEESAWEAVKIELLESIGSYEKQIAELQEQLAAHQKYMAELNHLQRGFPDVKN